VPLSVVSSTTGNNGVAGASSTTIILAPASITSGNLLVAIVGTGGGSAITVPSGWTLYKVVAASGGSPALNIYWKIATGSEPSSYTFTLSPVDTLLVSILNISGANTITPFNGNFSKYLASSSATVGSTTGTPSIATYLSCLPIGIYSIEQLLPSNAGAPTGLTAGWTGLLLNVMQDPSNYNNYLNLNGYNAYYVTTGPLTSSTSVAVTAGCTWGGTYSTFSGAELLLLVNPIESMYGTLAAYPTSVDLIGTGVPEGMKVSLVETNYTGSFSVTVPTAYQSIVSVCATQGGTYGTSCSVSGPTNSFWMQGIAPGAFQIDVSGG
jgi:hypothetical protein